MPLLIAPTARLHASWLAARDEWGRGVHQDGSGLHDTDDVETPADFADWVRRLIAHADPAVPPRAGWVHASHWWIVEDETYLGAITLRHSLTAALLEVGGHIGYGVRPSARGRGLATWALGAVLPEARALGLDRVLLTCREDNVASRRVIEHHGGVLEDVRGGSRRYWIRL